MKRNFIHTLLIILVLLVSCSKQPSASQSESAGVIPTTQPAPVSIWFPPYLPDALTKGYQPANGLRVSDSQASSELTLDVSDESLVAEWVYVLAAPFPTVADGISTRDLIQFWSGNQTADLPFDQLLVDGGTKAIYEKIWGPASVSNVSVVSRDELLSTAWEKKTSWAIIPFEMLEPRWKVIALDGQSPLDKDFNRSLYSLVVPFSMIGDPAVVGDFQTSFGRDSESPVFPATNRDPEKLTTVMVTGVTALVRGTAFLMERNGMTYPAIDIGDLLRNADILHISNEIPFTQTCPNPFANPENDANLVFCSKPEYIQLLEAIGTDVVELTGDHFRDWGADAMLNTIDMYDQRGWKYYGGGRDFADGIKPALFDVNGNKIAFLGCNAKPPGYATASDTSPGAVHCDMSIMADQVKQVVAMGYQPIFTFQHLEYYSYNINPKLVDDFHKAADAGAVIVSGSQAHQPHGFEFYKGALLHYGLGNLFFDQYNESQEQRKAFIDEHVFYDNRYIGTNLITIQFIDMARPRLMTEDERTELLQDVFFASGW